MQPKTTKILFWTVTVLFLAFFSFGAVSELMQVPDAQKVLTDLGYPTYLNYILGIAKLLGAAAILQAWSKPLREWAYAGFTIDVIGAAASMYFAGLGIASAVFTCVFLVPLFLSYWLWKKMERS